jgi:hypothetical protein
VNVRAEEMTTMTDSDQAGSAPREEEPVTSQPADEPGYLTETGEAVGDDGSVVPIIGGLPAVEGSAWDIGAAADERGANLAEEQHRIRPDEGGREDSSGG